MDRFLKSNNLIEKTQPLRDCAKLFEREFEVEENEGSLVYRGAHFLTDFR